MTFDYRQAQLRIGAPVPPNSQHSAEFDVADAAAFPRIDFNLDIDALQGLPSARAYGMALGKMLFGAAMAGAFGEARAATSARGEALRLRLRFDAPALEAVRWERLHAPIGDSWAPLATAADTPISRFVPSPSWKVAAPRTSPARMLVVIASPPDLADYRLAPVPDADRTALLDMLGTVDGLDVVTLDAAAGRTASLENIRAQLAGGFDIVHFMCHGAVSPGGAVLYLEASTGEADPVETSRLVETFRVQERAPLLVVLSACESASGTRSDSFVPMAPAILEGSEVQAIVAMTDRVGMNTASRFMDQFYRRLFEHALVDVAVNEARARVQEDWDWSVPILFSRLRDNMLLDVTRDHRHTDLLTNADQAAATISVAAGMAKEAGDKETFRVLEELLMELTNSHRLLVRYASEFRDVAAQPTTFAADFGAFYVRFKALYDSETWTKEKMSCSRIETLADELKSKDPRTHEQVEDNIDGLIDSDWDLVHFFSTFLEHMNVRLEEIHAGLGSDVDRSIELARAYETEISPSFRRSKAMLDRMAESLINLR